MKILYFADLHADSRQVAKRMGSYLEDVRAKLYEIQRIAIDQADFTIFGGDWFDRWEVNDETKIQMLAVLKGWPHTIFWVKGNHDMPPDWTNATRRGSIGVLEAALADTGKICFLDHDEVLNEHGASVRAQLSGADWSPSIDADPTVYSLDRQEGVTHAIKIAHGMVMPPGGGWPFPATGMNEIDTTGIDLFLCAHTHWKTARLTMERRDGGLCLFYGPGSVARTARSQDHAPSVAIIHLRDGLVDIDEIALKSARPHAEVFGPEDEHVPGGNLFEGYAAALEQSGAANTMTPEEALAQLAAAGTAPEVIEGARGYLARAQEEMKNG